MRLQNAILDFLGNELKLESDHLLPDTSFADLGVDSVQLSELLHHLQDSLNLILPEDRISSLVTIADLLSLVEELEQS